MTEPRRAEIILSERARRAENENDNVILSNKKPRRAENLLVQRLPSFWHELKLFWMLAVKFRYGSKFRYEKSHL